MLSQNNMSKCCYKKKTKRVYTESSHLRIEKHEISQSDIDPNLIHFKKLRQ